MDKKMFFELVDACRDGLKFLDSLPKLVHVKCERENRAVFRKILTTALENSDGFYQGQCENVSVKTTYRKHKKKTCLASDLILVDNGVQCVNCEALVIEHGYEPDLLAHLSEQAEYYKAEILPLFQDSDDGFERYDALKNEFLENLWDVIYQHFEDIENG